MCSNHQCLTFWHWSGVTPYTSSYEFAGSCVFGKQSPGILSLRPLSCPRGRPYPEVTAAFLPSSLGRNHSFVLVFSTFPPVLVYGTDSTYLELRGFSWKRAPSNCRWPKPPAFRSAWSNGIRIFLNTLLTARTTSQ